MTPRNFTASEIESIAIKLLGERNRALSSKGELRFGTFATAVPKRRRYGDCRRIMPTFQKTWFVRHASRSPGL